jgi:predicted GNAT family acetyltransferase
MEELEFTDSSYNYHHGQSDNVLTAKLGGKVVGTLEYSIFEGKIYVNHIQVNPEHARKGYATKMVEQLAKNHGYENIMPGMVTQDGSALLATLDKNYNYDRVKASKKHLQRDSLVELLRKKSPEAALFFESLLDKGAEYTYYTWRDKTAMKDSIGGISFVDLDHLAEWTEGSKTNEHWEDEEAPQYVKDIIKKLESPMSEVRRVIRRLVAESLGEDSQQNFEAWFKDSKVVDAEGNPLVVHHGTNADFKAFDLKKTTQGIIWFTSNKSAIERGEVGAQGSGNIMDLFVSMKNPAGWDEYEKYGLSQLEAMGYDGAMLSNGDGTFDGFVFEPTQLKSVKNKGKWNPSSKNIFSEQSKSQERIRNGGLLLIKGPEVDGKRKLYVTQARDILTLNRLKKDDSQGRAAEMVILGDQINRVVLKDGKLVSTYIDWRSEEGQAVKLGLSGGQARGVVLNNNKTPLHWDTLRYNNVPMMLAGLQGAIMGIPGVELS